MEKRGERGGRERERRSGERERERGREKEGEKREKERQRLMIPTVSQAPLTLGSSSLFFKSVLSLSTMP